MKVLNFSDCEHIQVYKHGIRSLSFTKVLAMKSLLTVDNSLDTVIKREISVQSKYEQRDNIFAEGKGRKHIISKTLTANPSKNSCPTRIIESCKDIDRAKVLAEMTLSHFLESHAQKFCSLLNHWES